MRSTLVILATLAGDRPLPHRLLGQLERGTRGAPARPRGTTVDITIKNGKVTPNGDRVKATVGEPVTLHIDADRPGEIHVHSTPEQQIEFAKGTSTKKLTIDKPGIVDVEDHALDQVIVQLEVS